MSEQGSVTYTNTKDLIPPPIQTLARQGSDRAYTVGKFRFEFELDGGQVRVTFDANTTDVSDSGFVPSLQTFIAAIPTIEVRERLEMLADYAGAGDSHDVLNDTEEYLQRVQQWYREVLGNSFGIEVSAGVKMMMTLIEIELRRRQQSKQSRVTVVSRPPRRKSSGFVYLLQSPTGYYKIGLTSDPQNRAKTFGIQLPFEVEFLALIPTDDMRELEQDLHRRFASKRANGEWFALEDADVDYIKGLAS